MPDYPREIDAPIAGKILVKDEYEEIAWSNPTETLLRVRLRVLQRYGSPSEAAALEAAIESAKAEGRWA